MAKADLERTATVFHTTNWTLVEALSDPGSPDFDKAAERLAERYWPAVYATLRRKGRRPEQAAEETQAFFVDVVVGRRLLGRARLEKGRLRSFILTALNNYLCDLHRRASARAASSMLSLGDTGPEERFLATAESVGPDEVFEQRWTMAVLEEAVERCGHYFEDAGLDRHWEGFRRVVLVPAWTGGSPPPRPQLAQDLGFASPTHLASALQVVRKRMRILIREVVSETAITPADQDEEYARVCAMLR